MTVQDYTRAIEQQYSPGNLAGAILEGLRRTGKDPEHPAPTDLTPVDQFHIGAREATLDLLDLAELRPDMAVLDVGGGLGGAARTLAAERDCRVTVLDLTEEYCRVGELLTARAGLAQRVTFCHGDALDLPFPGGSFDAAWTQHSTMNIADKGHLYRELRRVLLPGGRLAFHEIMAGPVAPIHLPVAWARDPTLSFLSTPGEIRALLDDLGFRELAWRDVTAASLDWWHARLAVAVTQSGPPPLGLHLILGADTAAIGRNTVRNLEESRIAVVQAVFQRP